MNSYELLDCGHGHRLEKFGNNVVMRPEKIATFSPLNPLASWQWDARCESVGKGQYAWQKKETWNENWIVDWEGIRLALRANESLNVGMFPEQMANWEWLQKQCTHPAPKILNLFGYTGGATMVMAKAGAHVTHVDSAKSAINAGKANQHLSNMDEKPIRWICDDAFTFVEREIKRGNRYDGIILDPPAFGRSKKGAFKFENDIHEFLEGCKQLLSDNPLFILFNCYATGLNPRDTGILLRDALNMGDVDTGWLSLTRANGKKALNCSTYARVEF